MKKILALVIVILISFATVAFASESEAVKLNIGGGNNFRYAVEYKECPVSGEKLCIHGEKSDCPLCDRECVRACCNEYCAVKEQCIRDVCESICEGRDATQSRTHRRRHGNCN